jgi:protein SCO1/2
MDRRHIALLFTVGVLALALGIVGIRGLADTRTTDAEPVVHAPASKFEGAVLPPGVRTPRFSLRDQDGRRVSLAQYRGRTVVVTFLYSNCKTECPVQAQQIKGALDDLGHDVPALAISVDPARDKPRSVRHFNREQGVAGRLRWVLGSEGQLRRLWKGFAIVPQTDGQSHLARIVLIDRHGVQRVGFPASQTTPERLAHDLRALERE